MKLSGPSLVLALLILWGCGEVPPDPTAGGEPQETSGSQDELTIRWTPRVKLKDLSELKALDDYLDAPVITVNGRETINMVEIEGKSEAVATTPRQWLELRGKGYVPRTTYDIKAEGWFKSVVLPKLYLATARPARVSHLREFRLTDRPLDHLPPDLGLILSPEDENRITRFARGETWGEICPKLKLQIKDEYSIILADDCEKNYIDLLAWADFDGDGIEDVLLDVANYAIQGTLCVYRYVILTRKTPGGRLLVIRDEQ